MLHAATVNILHIIFRGVVSELAAAVAHVGNRQFLAIKNQGVVSAWWRQFCQFRTDRASKSMRNNPFEFLESPSVRNIDIGWPATTAAIQIPNCRYVSCPWMLAHEALGPNLTELFPVGKKKNDVIPERGPILQCAQSFKQRDNTRSIVGGPGSCTDGIVVRKIRPLERC